MGKQKGKAADQFNGLLIVDKPGRTRAAAGDSTGEGRAAAGDNVEREFPTSHDVVQQARRWSKQRRIGHTGTLDPLASGVLVLCMGPSTRLAEYYQGHSKQYYAEIVLGSSTNTYDAFGELLEERPIPSLTAAQIEAELNNFRGTIQQKPPIFSALKQDGESMHRKARRGETIEVKPRTVTLHTLDLIDFCSPNRIAIRTTCSAGTYIRSLAYDLGSALGTAAHLDILRREAAGPFTLDDATPLASLAEAAENNLLHRHLHPPASRLDLPEIELTNELITRFGYGQKVVLELSGSWGQDAPQIDKTASVAEDQRDDLVIAKAIDPHGNFAGIVRLLGDAKRDEGDQAQKHATVWKAEKWFAN